MNFFSRIKVRHWAWINFLFATGIGLPLSTLVNPNWIFRADIEHVILIAAMAVSILGTITTILGYLMSQQRGKAGTIGVSIELSGLCLSVLAPATYLLVQVASFFSPHHLSLGGLIFCYALCAVYLYRFTIVVPRFRFEAHTPSEE